MKVMVVPTAGPLREEDIAAEDLHAFQRLVGGYIEVVVVPGGLMVLDEEGKLKGKDPNIIATRLYGLSDVVVGDAVLVGPADADGEFTELPGVLAELARLHEASL